MGQVSTVDFKNPCDLLTRGVSWCVCKATSTTQSPNATQYVEHRVLMDPTRGQLIPSHVSCVGSVMQTWMCLATVACWYIILCRKCLVVRVSIVSAPTVVESGLSNNASCSLPILCRNLKTTHSCFCSRLRPPTLKPRIRLHVGRWSRALSAVETVYQHSSLCVVSLGVFTHMQTSGHTHSQPVTLCLASDMSTRQINSRLFTLPPSEVINNGSCGQSPDCRML